MVETLYEAIYEDGGANGARDAMGRIVRKTERIVSGDASTKESAAATRVLDFVGWLVLFAGMTWLMRSVGLWVAVVVVAVAQVGVVSEPLRRRWKSSLLGGLVFVFCAGVLLASETRELASALPAIGLVSVGALLDLRRGPFDRRRLPLPAWVGLAVLGIGLALVLVGTAAGQRALFLPGVAAGFVVCARAALPGRGAGGALPVAAVVAVRPEPRALSGGYLK